MTPQENRLRTLVDATAFSDFPERLDSSPKIANATELKDALRAGTLVSNVPVGRVYGRTIEEVDAMAGRRFKHDGLTVELTGRAVWTANGWGYAYEAAALGVGEAMYWITGDALQPIPAEG